MYNDSYTEYGVFLVYNNYYKLYPSINSVTIK